MEDKVAAPCPFYDESTSYRDRQQATTISPLLETWSPIIRTPYAHGIRMVWPRACGRISARWASSSPVTTALAAFHPDRAEFFEDPVSQPSSSAVRLLVAGEVEASGSIYWIGRQAPAGAFERMRAYERLLLECSPPLAQRSDLERATLVVSLLALERGEHLRGGSSFVLAGACPYRRRLRQYTSSRRCLFVCFGLFRQPSRFGHALVHVVDETPGRSDYQPYPSARKRGSSQPFARRRGLAVTP